MDPQSSMSVGCLIRIIRANMDVRESETPLGVQIEEGGAIHGIEAVELHTFADGSKAIVLSLLPVSRLAEAGESKNQIELFDLRKRRMKFLVDLLFEALAGFEGSER